MLAKGVLEVCLNGLRVGLVPAGLVGCTVVGDQALGLFIFELVFGPTNNKLVSLLYRELIGTLYVAP